LKVHLPLLPLLRTTTTNLRNLTPPSHYWGLGPRIKYKSLMVKIDEFLSS
jgi:hypothetical protein